MNNWVLRKAQELLAQGVPFALATVVRRERPTSGEPGDKAIITADGNLIGWVGGSCAQPTVVKEAQGAIADGEPRLVIITPNPAERSREGAILYHMTCYSGGTLEIHVEPYLPEPQLIVCGASPATQALVRIGKAVGFQVVLIDPTAVEQESIGADLVLARVEKDRLPPCRERYVVVATMGNWDEQAVMELLTLSPDYIGVIASKKRFRQMMQGIHSGWHFAGEARFDQVSGGPRYPGADSPGGCLERGGGDRLHPAHARIADRARSDTIGIHNGRRSGLSHDRRCSHNPDDGPV